MNDQLIQAEFDKALAERNLPEKLARYLYDGGDESEECGWNTLEEEAKAYWRKQAAKTIAFIRKYDQEHGVYVHFAGTSGELISGTVEAHRVGYSAPKKGGLPEETPEPRARGVETMGYYISRTEKCPACHGPMTVYTDSEERWCGNSRCPSNALEKEQPSQPQEQGPEEQGPEEQPHVERHHSG